MASKYIQEVRPGDRYLAWPKSSDHVVTVERVETDFSGYTDRYTVFTTDNHRLHYYGGEQVILADPQ